MESLEQKTITSMEVAEMVGKDHSKLLRDMRTYGEQLAEAKIGLGDFFAESTYQDANNQTRPCFMVTKKGCEFIAHKLTGTKGAVFTAKYINKFHDMEEVIRKPMSAIEQLKLQKEALLEINEKVDTVETKVNRLENTMNIDYAQMKQIKNFANEVVVNALGGKGSRAYRYKDENGAKLSSQAFSRFWHDFNDYFNINAYANLPRVKFDDALEYINAYRLPVNTQLEIGKINREREEM